MKIIESLEKRRSYYSIGKELPVSEAQVTALVEKLAELQHEELAGRRGVG